jgi:hypothetical protein
MFIRSSTRPQGRSLSRPVVWTLLSVLYVGYPAGCILRLLHAGLPSAPAWNVVGVGLITAAFVAFFLLAGSSLQRLAQEQSGKLDERELMQRNRAAYRAYGSLSGVALLGLIYMSLQPDIAKKDIVLWIPTTYDHWNAVFWGAFILATTLPSVFLSMESDPADLE